MVIADPVIADGVTPPRGSQVALTEEDAAGPGDRMPEGLRDVNGQQLDLRDRNSWTMTLAEVSTPEVGDDRGSRH